MILPPLAIPGVALAGLVVGSFVTTAALRSVRGEQAVSGRSRCDDCGAGLSLAATTPVISYFARAGACSHCGARIDPLHPAGEAAGAALAVVAVLAVASPGRAVLIAVLGMVLLAASVVDARVRRLPDRLTALAALICLGLAALNGAALAGLTAAAMTFAVLEGVRRGFLLLKRKPGLGFGDVKLLAALAPWLGFATPWAVVVAALLGLAAFAVLRPADGRLAFGPAIAVAGLFTGLLAEAGFAPIRGVFG